MLRDIRKAKVQFLSIFIMSFLGMYIFVGMDSEVTGMSKGEFDYYTEQNLADLWVEGADFSSESASVVSNIPGVSKTVRRIQSPGKAVLPDREADMSINFIENDEISSTYRISGDPYSVGERGVWIDPFFAKKNHLSIGDTITLKIDGVEWDEIIRGTIYNPEYVYFLPNVAALMPEYGTYGMCFMDSAESRMAGGAKWNQLLLDLKNVDNRDGLSDQEKAECSRISREIRKALDNDSLAVLTKDDNLSYQTFRAEMDQHEAMSFMFPIVFLLISVMGIITTMTRMTSRQRVQIGTLKALGFSRRTIMLHYVTYGGFLSLIGSVLGGFAGYSTITDLIMGMMKDTYIFPSYEPGLSGKAVFMVIFEVAVSSGVGYISCRKELAPPPAETLRPESPKNLKHSAFEKSRFWRGLGFNVQWNIRDIMRNRLRTCMGVLGVAGCTMLLISAFGCLDSVNFFTVWMYGELNTASSQITFKEGTDPDDVKDYALQYSGQMIETVAADFEVLSDDGDTIKKTGTVTAVGKGNLMHFQNHQLKYIDFTDTGVAMSSKMALSLGIKEGDFVRWHITGADKWYRDRVVQIYRNPSSQGITMKEDVFRDHDIAFRPSVVLTNCIPDPSIEDRDEVISVQNTGEMMSSIEEMKKMMYVMMGIFIVVATVLGIVVLYNLGVLSIVEKARDMATLKVLGFPVGMIRWILIMQNLWITIAGVIAGIPLGRLLLDGIMADMPESMDYMGVIKMPSYFLSVIGTFILSMGISVLLSRKVKSIDMVDALKGVE